MCDLRTTIRPWRNVGGIEYEIQCFKGGGAILLFATSKHKHINVVLECGKLIFIGQERLDSSTHNWRTQDVRRGRVIPKRTLVRRRRNREAQFGH